MDTFQLNILSASSAFYEGECESLVVPTPDGKCGVLAHHSNAIAAISPGELSYTVPGEKPRLAAVSHGMIKIEDNHVLVLVETAEKPEDIDRIRNQQKADAAREALLEEYGEQIDLSNTEGILTPDNNGIYHIKTQAQLARALTRLRVKHHSENLD